MHTSDTQNEHTSTRPFSYWLKAADRLMAAESATTFDGEHASRRDWRLLTTIDGTAPARRPLNRHALRGLVARGWVVADGDGWTLTDDGRAAKDRLTAVVDGIRAKVADTLSEEELATTLASLEKVARAFGWDEETPLPRGRGRRHGFGGHERGFGPGFGPTFGRGFGPGFGRGFGPERGFGRGHGFDHERHEHGRHEHGGPQRAIRHAQHAYERGFDAGFSRGRDA